MLVLVGTRRLAVEPGGGGRCTGAIAVFWMLEPRETICAASPRVGGGHNPVVIDPSVPLRHIKATVTFASMNFSAVEGALNLIGPLDENHQLKLSA